MILSVFYVERSTVIYSMRDEKQHLWTECIFNEYIVNLNFSIAILSKNTTFSRHARQQARWIDFCQYLTKHCQPFPQVQSKLFSEDISFNAMRINTGKSFKYIYIYMAKRPKIWQLFLQIAYACFSQNARIFLTTVHFGTLFSPLLFFAITFVHGDNAHISRSGSNSVGSE